MLSERSVVLDMEDFCYKKNGFVVEELAITTSDYGDRLIFLPPVNFNITTQARTESLQLVNKLFTQSTLGKR